MNKTKVIAGIMVLLLLLHVGSYWFFRSNPVEIASKVRHQVSWIGFGTVADNDSAAAFFNFLYRPLLKLDRSLTGMPYDFSNVSDRDLRWVRK